jgi:hypothetical protein
VFCDKPLWPFLDALCGGAFEGLQKKSCFSLWPFFDTGGWGWDETKNRASRIREQEFEI